MIFNLLLLAIVFICVAMMWTEGMWGNAIRTVNTLFAAMLATNYFEPLADYLEGHAASYSYMWDFLSIWFIFALAFNLLRACTDAISKYQVRFRLPIEYAGRAIFAVWTAWILVCFFNFSVHTAPLARTAFQGGFASKPTSLSFFGLAPDRKWLGFAQSRSRGALSKKDAGNRSRFPEDNGKNVFDPNSEFIFKYAQRREELQKHNAKKGTLRVN